MLFHCLRLLPWLALPLIASAAPDIVRVWTAYRTADSFKRVSEFFGGTEDTGDERVLRSRPGERDGYYFLVRLQNAATHSGASVTVAIVFPGSHEARKFVFPTDLPAGERVFQFGVTGPDWPGPKVRPAAWQVTVVAADGSVLAAQRSFLWSDATR